MKSLLALAIALVWLFSARTSPAATDESNEAARRHFHRGVELYEERDFAGAATEFGRAYQLAPHFRILYNLGQVAEEQHDWAAALGHFGRYLKDGAGQLPEERRAEVEQEIAKLRERVGRLVVVTRAEDAEILVDGVPVVRAPGTRPIVVNLGRRRIELQNAEQRSQPQWVEVAGAETAVVELNFPAKFSEPPAPIETKPVQPAEPHAATGGSTWWAWMGASLCAAGAAATGTLAYRWSRDLRDRRDSFPVTQQDLQDDQRKVRHMAWLTDGLLAGTAVFTGIALFLSFHDSGPRQGVAVGPGSLWWKGTF
jgi:hypothetical protein